MRNCGGSWTPLRAIRCKVTASKHEKAEDLSDALRHTSKLRVTNKEFATLVADLDNFKGPSKSGDVAASSQNTKATPKHKSYKRSSLGQRDTPETSLRRKTNERLLKGFLDGKHTDREADDTHERLGWTADRKLGAKQKSVRGITAGNSPVVQSNTLDNSTIPRLQHNLDRALFSPGVHFLQDPRTRVYNFTPYLKSIIKHTDFNFEAIGSFVNVSKDATLLQAANEHGKQFYSSTSSMTSALIQFYYLLNNYDAASSDRFPFPKFTGASARLPASLIIQPKGKNPENGQTVYAVESDKSADTEILLSAMGHCLEALLTTEEKQFEQYKVSSSETPPPTPNTYNYATYGDFLMRSQLDCYDERLPGNGTFDLKTRAVCAIRYDSGNPHLENNQYQIWKLNGQFESFEREYNDLIRTGALLKYGFQARIGQMDGIYVAYHNINSFFGFQYIPLDEIDRVFYSYDKGAPKSINVKKLEDLHDDLPSFVADTQFKMSLDVWTNMLKTIIDDLKAEHGETAFRLVLKTMRRVGYLRHRMHVMAVPLSSEQVSTLQAFPKSFKTSFREDIDPQERFANLQDHSSKLDAFNEDTAKAGVLSYYVYVENLFGSNKSSIKDPHGYPRHKSQPWSLSYTIKRVERGSGRYLELLREATKLLTNNEPQHAPEPPEEETEINIEDPADLMKAYLAIGAARATRWEPKDEARVVYKPKQ